jgi:ribosomal protein S18 acetylase RimI-like enzyme
MNFEFLEVTDKAQIEKLAGIAKQIWFEYFPGVVTVEQVDYMIEKYQSVNAITQQILNDGYQYFLLLGDGEVLGYIGFKGEADKLFLSKLYLKKESRGKEYFSQMLSFVEKIARERNLKGLYLTVNKHNDNSIGVYCKKGFSVIKEQITDIGNGFIMDDYVMEKSFQ